MAQGREVRDLMSAEEIDFALSKIVKEIDTQIDDGELILIGIRRRGVPLAERLAAKLRTAGREVNVGILDITLYRDDLSEIGPVPMVGKTDLPFRISGYPLILVDDVLNTGRTIRAALDCLNDFGRPKLIHLAVVVDRGGRELPISPNYCGLKMDLGSEYLVQVNLQEIDGEDRAVLLQPD